MPEERIEKYRLRIPDILTDHWSSIGICGYADGAFWLTDPAEFDVVVRMAPLLQGGEVIGRTAFGALFVWRDGKCGYYTPLTGHLTEGEANLALFLNSSCCSPGFRNATWQLGDFRKARSRLGRLSHDECYGYVPLPSLGGSGSVDTTRKVKMIPYIELVRQSLE